MKFAYILEISFRNLLNRKTRSILTITGVVIGVSAITFLTSLGYGFERMTTAQIANEDAMTVFESALDESDLLSINDETIAKIKNLEIVDEVVPAVTLAGKAVLNEIKTDVVVNGYSREFFELNGSRMFRGEMFANEDRDVAVVSTALLRALDIEPNNYDNKTLNLEIAVNSDISPTLEEGEIVELRNIKIIGVIDENLSAFAIIPKAQIQQDVKTVNFTTIRVKVGEQSEIGTARIKVEEMGFYTSYIGDTILQINAFFTIFRYIVGGFGVIAMLVAVLGMLNTLTVSLLERTKEIGVLKSNGATRRVIWQLFLSEGLIISFIGGMLGIVIGILIGEGVNIVFNFYAINNGAEPIDFYYTPIRFVLMAMLFVVVVGFLTGLFPAGRATKIKVLDALKYE